MQQYRLEMSLTEFCQELDVDRSVCVELVECGVLNPPGKGPEDWIFDPHMAALLVRSVRLQQELDLDWSAVAMLIRLLEERDGLRQENELLRQRLERFLTD